MQPCNLRTHLHLKHHTQYFQTNICISCVILAEKLCSGTPKNMAMSLFMLQ